MEDIIRIRQQDGSIDVVKMTNSQVCECVLQHIESREDRRAFNLGLKSVDVEGVNYKLVNLEC